MTQPVLTTYWPLVQTIFYQSNQNLLRLSVLSELLQKNKGADLQMYSYSIVTYLTSQYPEIKEAANPYKFILLTLNHKLLPYENERRNSVCH